jgi:signal transduction histidine kinase
VDMLLDYFKVVLLLSIPQAISHLWFIFAVWGLKPRLHTNKLFLFAVINSLIIDLDIFRAPTEIHAVTSFLVTFILVNILFRPFGFKKVLIVFLSLTVLIMLTEMLGALSTQLIYGIEAQNIEINQHFPQLLSIGLPLFLLLYFLSHYIENRNIRFFNQLYQYLINIKQNRMKEILVLSFFQAILLVMLLIIGVENKHKYSAATYNFVIYTLILITFCVFFYILRLLVRIREEAVRQTQDVYVDDIIKMFTVIRGQRHDFLNHVQVMYSMLKMNKLEQLNSYMADVVKEAHSVDQVIHHSSPTLAAFIQMKMEMALSRSITFTYDVPKTIDIESSIKSIDLVKIMGNLIDNAFEESDTLPVEQRIVHLSILIADGTLRIEVRNHSRLLTVTDKEKMLLPGFTTKKSGHTGIGLAIVHERVQYYKGTLSIQSSIEQGTAILVTLPH